MFLKMRRCISEECQLRCGTTDFPKLNSGGPGDALHMFSNGQGCYDIYSLYSLDVFF